MLSSDIHPCNCTCDTCMDDDCAAIIAAAPRSTWTRQRLEWIRGVRMKPLNWNLEEGHCALCGGTELSAWKQGEHWLVRNHNPVVVGNIVYTSVLVADQGSWSATYREFTKRGKDALKKWALNMVGASRLEKVYRPNAKSLCGYDVDETTEVTGIAVRKVEHWTEIRIGIRVAA